MYSVVNGLVVARATEMHRSFHNFWVRGYEITALIPALNLPLSGYTPQDTFSLVLWMYPFEERKSRAWTHARTSTCIQTQNIAFFACMCWLLNSQQSMQVSFLHESAWMFVTIPAHTSMCSKHKSLFVFRISFLGYKHHPKALDEHTLTVHTCNSFLYAWCFLVDVSAPPPMVVHPTPRMVSHGHVSRSGLWSTNRYLVAQLRDKQLVLAF